jgi:hypothetical protein
MKIMQMLREKTGLKSAVSRTVTIGAGADAVVLGIKSPNTLNLAELQEECRKKAEAELMRKYGEGKLKAFKQQEPDPGIMAARQEAAKKQGVELDPVPNEYERLLSAKTETILMMGLVPLMVCDPETGELASESPEDTAYLQDLASVNPELFTAISEEMAAYGKRIRGMSSDKKKPTKKRTRSKSSANG